MLFAILKQLAENGTPIYGEGVIEVLPDGFGFCATPKRTIARALMIFMCRQRLSKSSACAPAIPWKVC
jgi:transcription termination factor Rho